jgi:hypothetical protein
LLFLTIVAIDQLSSVLRNRLTHGAKFSAQVPL